MLGNKTTKFQIERAKYMLEQPIQEGFMEAGVCCVTFQEVFA